MPVFDGFADGHLGGDARSFLDFVHTLQNPDFFACVGFRIAVLRDSTAIMLYHAVRRIHYGLGGAIISLEPYHLTFRIILLEVKYVLHPRATECVDGLGVVSHHAYIMVLEREFSYYVILGEVSVLILVHHYVREPVTQGKQSLSVISQQNVHIKQDVIEIHNSAVSHLVLIEPVQVADSRLARLTVRVQQLGARGVALKSNEIVLRTRDPAQHVLRLVELVVEAQCLYARLDGRDGIGRVVNSEILRIAQKFGIFPEKAHENCVKSSHSHPFRGDVTDHQCDSLLHLRGGLLRKGQGQYPRGIHPGSHHICHSACQNPRFSGSCSGDDENGAFHRLDRLFLFVVKSFQYRL